MGMSIDEAIGVSETCQYILSNQVGSNWCKSKYDAVTIAIDTMRKYQKLQADYENRLKADMVAMLTDIQLEIREYHEIGCDEDCNNCRMVGCVEPVNVIKDLDIIQQKIDVLRGKV